MHLIKARILNYQTIPVPEIPRLSSYIIYCHPNIRPYKTQLQVFRIPPWCSYRPSQFWDIMRRILGAEFRSFRTGYRSHLQRSFQGCSTLQYEKNRMFRNVGSHRTKLHGLTSHKSEGHIEFVISLLN